MVSAVSASGVSAGVVGLDGQGSADIVNRSALTLLSATRDDVIGRELGIAIPEVADLIRQAMAHPEGRAQGHVDLVRNVPERLKPRTIAIGNGSATKQVEASA